MINGQVVAVSASPAHAFSKNVLPQITLLAGLGVEGDAHCGDKVKHRSRVAKDPTRPNLRQVHLLHEELFAELAELGFSVQPGQLGENITLRGLDLLALPVGSLLSIGTLAVVRLTGLRNPCAQIDRFQEGLLSAVVDKTADGKIVRKTGVMGIVLEGGIVKPGDSVALTVPPKPHLKLDRV